MVQIENHNSSYIFKRLLQEHVRPHLPKLMFAFVFMAIIAATTGITAWLFDPAIKKIFIEKDKAMLITIPIAIIIVMLTKCLAVYGQVFLMTAVGQKVIADTQIKMFKNITYSDLARLHDIHSGKIISNFLYDVAKLETAVSDGLTHLVRDGLTLLCLIGVMYYQDWQLALIATLVFPFVAILAKKFGKRMRKASKQGQEETGNLATFLSEVLDGTRVIKVYQQEQSEIERVIKTIYRRMELLLKAARTRALSSPIAEFIAGFGIAGSIYYAGSKGISGEMELNQFVSFLTAMMLSYQPLRSLANLNVKLQEGFAAAVRIFALLDTAPKVKEIENAEILTVKKASINFQNVSFEYSDGTRALKNVTLDALPGTVNALVGPSGSGKSTIMNLIPRFYDPANGYINISNKDVKKVTISSLRKALALVSQEAILFDATIKTNIAYGNPDATDEEIQNAAKLAAAHEFIVKCRDGYDTVIGENGVKLSGGEKQRLSIARAMLKDAPILLLDEATSSLDTESEKKVQEALKRLMKGKTTLIIAHRLSTVISADKIFVVKNGEIVESGKHNELLVKNGIYSSLYRNQILSE